MQSMEDAGLTGTGQFSSSHPDKGVGEASVLSGVGSARPVGSSPHSASASTLQLSLMPLGVACSFTCSSKGIAIIRQTACGFEPRGGTHCS